jgi:hypothetical protein
MQGEWETAAHNGMSAQRSLGYQAGTSPNFPSL